MATITERKGAYRIRVSAGYDINGKQIIKSTTWKPEPNMTKKQIEKELERQAVLFEEKVKNNQANDGSIKFEAIAKEWFEQIEKDGRMKPLSLKRFKSCRERTYKAIGHLQLSKITKRTVQSFINNLAENGINKATGGGLSAKTQSLYLNFISDVFNYAIDCGVVNFNPCHGVHTIKTEKQERKVYTLEEAQEFIQALEKAPPKYRMFFLLAIYGGFRRGELLGFEWKDIDFETGVITVNRTSLYDKAQGGMFVSSPKTKGSCRSLKLPFAIIEELKFYKKWQLEERFKVCDQWQDTDRLFTTWNGAPMSSDTVRHWLEKFCTKENLPYVNIHSFRHLNASLLINNGVDIKTVSAALGHSQTSTTLNIYAHTFAAAQAKASEAIAQTIGFKKHEKNA